MSNEKPKIKRSQFLDILSSLSKDDVAQIIAKKGKDPKPIKPFIMHRLDN